MPSDNVEDKAAPPLPGGLRIPKSIAALGGTLAFLTGVVVSITQITTGISSLEGKLPAPAIWGIGALLVVLGAVVIVWSIRVPISEVNRQVKVRDGAVAPQDLAGRDEDLRHLGDACRENRLVFLVGDSGVGKSALLRAGLCPSLAADPLLLPVYLDRWGTEWGSGEQRALIEVLWQTLKKLSEEERRVCRVPELPPDAAEFVRLLRAVHDELHRHVLIVFDQFDDYQTQQSAHFSPPNKRQALNAEQLREANPFWEHIAALVQEDVIRCVFATRRDAQLGLEAVRFVDPFIFMLSRIDEETAKQVLDSLFVSVRENRPASLTNTPEGTWKALRKRFIRDLVETDASGTVLPAQLRVAAKGLLELPLLTVVEYERAGGLLGLEVGHLLRCLAIAASTAALDEALGRKVLVAMMVRGMSRPKAQQRSFGELLEELLPDSKSAAEGVLTATKGKLKIFLEHLEKSQVVRPMLQPDEPTSYWTLYHDYVARTVRELARRTDRWTAVLEDSKRDYDKPGSPLAKWRSLLPLGTQLQLLFRRFLSRASRGDFRYNEHRRYAAVSAVRAVPWLMALIGLGFGAVQWSRIDRAQALFEKLNPDQQFPTQRDVNALWEITRAEPAVKLALFDRALASPDLSSKLARGVEMITHAAVGTNATRRREIEAVVGKRCFGHAKLEWPIKNACARTLIALESDTVEGIAFSAQVMLEGLADPNAPATSQDSLWISQRLQRLGTLAKLPEKQARILGRNAIAQMESESRIDKLKPLAAFVVALPITWSSTDLKPALATITTAAPSGDNFRPKYDRLRLQWRLATRCSDLEGVFASLLAGLEPLAPSAFDADDDDSSSDFSRERNTDVLVALVDHIESAVDAARLPDLSSALQAFMVSLPIDKRREGLLARLEKLRRASPHPSAREAKDLSEHENLTAALNIARSTGRAELESMHAPDMADALDRAVQMFEGVSAFHVELSKKTLGRSDNAKLAGLLHRTFHELPELGIILLADDDYFGGFDFSGRDEELRWSRSLVAAVTTLQSALRSTPFSAALRAKPPAETAPDAAITLANLLLKLESPGGGIKAIPFMPFDASSGSLKVSDIPPAAERIVAAAERAMADDTSAYQLFLVAILQTVAKDNHDEVLRQLIDLVAKRALTARGSAIICASIEEFRQQRDAPNGLTNASIAAENIITMIRENKAPNSVRLGKALRVLTQLVTDAQAQATARSVLAAMEITTDTASFDELRSALVGKVEDAAEAKRVAQLLKWPTCVDACRTDLLRVFQRVSGNRAGTQYWAAVDWARTQGWNVDAPPVAPPVAEKAP